MDSFNNWPNELMIHYWRLDDNFRNVIQSFIHKNSDLKADKLKNFIDNIAVIYKLQGIIVNNSEFLFLAANTFVLQGSFEEVYEICAKDDFHPGLLNTKAYALISQRKFEDVEDVIAKAEQLGRADPFNELYTKAIKLLYYYYSQQFEKIESDLESLSIHYQRLRDQFSDDKNLILAFTEMFALGKSVFINLKRREGKLKEGVTIGQELIGLVRESKNRYLLNRLLNNTALCAIEQGDLKLGLEYLEESFKFSEILANQLQLAVMANNIGFIYRNMGNLEMAMKYFYTALENAKNADVDTHYIVVATETNIAHLHLDFGNAKLALSDSDIALESLKKSKVSVPPNIKIALDLCRADIFERLDRFSDAEGTIGFITPVSEHFCFKCNRLRLTADGRLLPCLLSDEEIDLRPAIRKKATPQEIKKLILEAIAAKPKGHQLDKGSVPGKRLMTQVGG